MEKTNDQNKTTKDPKLLEYAWPDAEHLDVWIGKERGRLFVSVRVAVNTMWVTLRQEEGKWVGDGVLSTLVGTPPGSSEEERENEMYNLLSNITDVRIMTNKSKGKGLDFILSINNILWIVLSTKKIFCRRHSCPPVRRLEGNLCQRNI